MKIIKIHEQLGTIEYNENFWTGKRTIKINDIVLKKVKKNIYTSEGYDAVVTGSLLSGIVLKANGIYISIYGKPSTYEFVLAFLPLIFVIIWGNIPHLCSIFPIVGGAIGGAISGAFGAASLMLMNAQTKLRNKLLISFVSFIATVLVCYLVAIVILSLK